MSTSFPASTSKDSAVRHDALRLMVLVAWSLGVLQGCRGDVLQAPESVTRPRAETPSRVVLDRDTVQFGGAVVVSGEGLPTDTVGVRADLGAAPVRIDSTARGRVWLRIPAQSARCAASRDTLRLSGAGWVVRLPVVVGPAMRAALEPGASAVVATDASGACLDLAVPDVGEARYVLTVMNPVDDAGHVATYTLTGIGLGHLASRQTVVQADASLQRAAGASTGSLLAGERGTVAPMLVDAVASANDVLAAHGAWLHALQAMPGGRVNQTVGNRTAVVGPVPTPSVGEIIERRVATSACAKGVPVRARVAYVSPTTLLLEDVAAPQAGRMDSWLVQLGQEYDRVMLPLIRRSMGDPLANNGALDGDGRVTLLFTPVVNQAMPGTAAFVNACDLYPQAQQLGSSADEVMYVRVPTAADRPADWHRSVRSTLVHETKHLVSFAERIARGREFEEPWLEEATARMAEELYSRTFRGGGEWLGGTTFASSVACELSACDERPLVMYKHFAVLHQYLRDPAARSPLGATSAFDVTAYASGWSLLRTALDAANGDETALLQALVRGEAGSGVAALTKLTGISAPGLLESWTASLVEAETGAQSVGGRRSWDTGSMWRGLATLFPTVFRTAPLRVTHAEAGNWQLAGASVRGFSAAYTVLDGTASGVQRIELQPGAGQALRLRITRMP